MEKIIEKISMEVLKEVEKDTNVGKFNFLKCPDQYVATMRICQEDKPMVSYVKQIQTKSTSESNKGREQFYCRESASSSKSKELSNVIIIILESPHKDEYSEEDKKKIAKGPAYGKTGDKLNEFFPLVLRNAIIDKKMMIPDDEYEILLMNAIQFQCSLGESTTKYRDKIFSKCWENTSFKEDFVNRLRSYINMSENCIVINCCTKGKKNLQEMICEQIKEAIEDQTFYKCHHPSSWNIPIIQ